MSMDREKLIQIAVELLNLADLNSIKIEQTRCMTSYDNGMMIVSEPTGIMQFTIYGSYGEKKGEE